MPLPKKPRWLRKGDRIVTAWAESASGPGWANALIWIVVSDVENSLRRECLQPEEHTHELHVLFGVSQAVQRAMLAALEMKRKT